MRNSLLILLFPLLLSAQDRVPYKDYCGECYTMINDSTWVNGVWLPIPEENELNIKPSTTDWKTPKRYVMPEFNTFSPITASSTNGVTKSVNLSFLVFATLMYFFSIFKPNEKRAYKPF
jgi:hypothetical protein